jgi:hypothetical protein
VDKDHNKDWRELCKAVANELDPGKLMDLVAQLTRALDERDKKRRRITVDDPDDKDRTAGSLQSQPAV